MVRWLNHPIGKRLDITPLLITPKVVLLIQMSDMWSSDHMGVTEDMWLWQGHLKVTKSCDYNSIMWSWLDHMLWQSHVTQEYHFEGLDSEIPILQVATSLRLWIVTKLDIGSWHQGSWSFRLVPNIHASKRVWIGHQWYWSVVGDL